MPVTADDLEVATSAVVATLRPVTNRNWSVPAHGLEWDCWHTAEHVGDCLLSYAGQVAIQPSGRYVAFLVTANEGASPAEVLEVAEAGGRILAATVRSADPSTRGFHPTGQADPEGFAGMGCLEMLLHGHDIATAFGLTLDPPADTCARLLARMFPDQAAAVAGADPWTALLWCSGRGDLPGQERVTSWRWRGAPLGE